MKPILVTPRAALLHGDSRDMLKLLRPNSVDAVVTDPPYGLSAQPDMVEVLTHWLAGDDYNASGGGFMGKTWDSFVPGPHTWRQAYEALKPGGYLVAFFGTRTYDLGVVAIRLAGFEVRDMVSWLYGSGFPKSLNDDGLGTALKPACEPIVVARKPLDGTYEQNRAKWGTGWFNIDGCRIASEAPVQPVYGGGKGAAHATVFGHSGKYQFTPDEAGRWPANIALDEYAAGFLDGQTGERPSGQRKPGKTKGGMMREAGTEYHDAGAPASTGGASRFFYCPKATKKEKNAGLDHLPLRSGGEATDREDGSAGLNSPRAGAGRGGGTRNPHPTVKPLALMQWLVRLVTPPGGLVLDPFAGSGTTGVAALSEGCQFVGIEQGGDDGEYLPILKARIEHALAQNPTPAKAEP